MHVATRLVGKEGLEMLSKYINELVDYGVSKGLTPPSERMYTANLLLDLFHEHILTQNQEGGDTNRALEYILADLINEACSRGIIEDSIGNRDLFDTRLMNCLLPRPAQVKDTFETLHKVSAQKATDYFYKFSQDSDYIRRYRVAKDIKWTVTSPYGVIDITINLSKPEKDPKAIAAAQYAAVSDYPKCLLCMENEGYAGTMTHPARQNHRIIPLIMNESDWGFQYSPYVYYNEHCIVFNGQHIPMQINRQTFVKLFDFIKQFPHYFLGSNADLPIVGGSILSHDHFQGGNYTFAMAKAPIEVPVSIIGYEEVEVGIVKWPLSVLRLRSKDVKLLIDLADHVLAMWRTYTDEAAFVYAETDGEAHNTITPIARKVGEVYELDLTLRNNITTKEHPLGVYHPHHQHHNIKKENIGLIEVMGLAVLPARLKKEMELLAEYIVSGKDVQSDERIAKHAIWVRDCCRQYDRVTKDSVHKILKEEIGQTFIRVLEDSGVYKCNNEGRAAFLRFTSIL